MAWPDSAHPLCTRRRRCQYETEKKRHFQTNPLARCSWSSSGKARGGGTAEQTQIHCRCVIGKGLLRQSKASHAATQTVDKLCSDPAGVPKMPPPLPELFGPPVPTLFDKPCYFLLSILLHRSRFSKQVPMSPPGDSQRCGRAGGASCTPALAPSFLGGIKKKIKLTIFLCLFGKYIPGRPLQNNTSPLANKKKSNANYLLPKPLPSL